MTVQILGAALQEGGQAQVGCLLDTALGNEQAEVCVRLEGARQRP